MARACVPFEAQVRAAGLPAPVAEYRFAPPRRWRADWAWPSLMVMAECEGGVWSGGRHTRGAGFLADVEKYNEAAILGWLLVRFTPQMIASGEALALAERAVKARATKGAV